MGSRKALLRYGIHGETLAEVKLWCFVHRMHLVTAAFVTAYIAVGLPDLKSLNTTVIYGHWQCSWEGGLTPTIQTLVTARAESSMLCFVVLSQSAKASFFGSLVCMNELKENLYSALKSLQMYA